MMMTEDRIRVLEMLREGKISPEAAAELLDAMSGSMDVEEETAAEDAAAEDAAAKDAAAVYAGAASFEYAEHGTHADPVTPVEPVGPVEPVMPFDSVAAQDAVELEDADAALTGEDAVFSEQSAFTEDRTEEPPKVGGPLPPPIPRKTPHWLRVKVTDMVSGRPRVNLRVPIGLVGMGMKIGAHFSPEVREIDPALVMQAFQDGEVGPFVDVYDDDGGEHVEISLE
jgi:hypothetical protein